MNLLSDEKIIAALLENATLTAAAQQLGINRGTLTKRMKDADFQQAWREARQTLLESTTASLQSAAYLAATVARTTLADESTAPQTRINAAQMVLSNALRYTEQSDILRRLEILERSQQNE